MGKAPLVPGQVGKSPYLTLRIPAHQVAALNKRAAELSITRSAVVREAIDALLAGEVAEAAH